MTTSDRRKLKLTKEVKNNVFILVAEKKTINVFCFFFLDKNISKFFK